MGWKIVNVESDATIKLFLDNLIVYQNNEKISISIANIDTLIIDNFKVSLTVQLLNELANANCVVILCDKKHLPSTLILPFSGNYNSMKITEKQIGWSNNFKLINEWK